MRTLALLVALAVEGVSCAGQVDPPCVVPPPTLAASSHDLGVNLSVKLMSVPITPTLGTDLKSACSETFDKLSDDNAALYMCLQAIDCYLKRGKLGQSEAVSLMTFVQQRWGGVARPLAEHPQASEVLSTQLRIKQGYRRP
jgi:hypothetical protein